MCCPLILITLLSHLLQLAQQLLTQHLLQLRTLVCFLLLVMTNCQLTLQSCCLAAALFKLNPKPAGNTLLLLQAVVQRPCFFLLLLQLSLKLIS